MTNAEYLNQFQTYGLLALKAQNQCRATLATLAEIKHPSRATFIKNTATHQQINVGARVQSLENSGTSANELLRESPHATLDTPRTEAPIPPYPHLETVETRRCENP